jgi:hypothetical protein
LCATHGAQLGDEIHYMGWQLVTERMRGALSMWGMLPLDAGDELLQIPTGWLQE